MTLITQLNPDHDAPVTQRQALITVPPRQANARPMSITEGDLPGIGFRVLFLLPAAMGFLGLSVWWSRRP